MSTLRWDSHCSLAPHGTARIYAIGLDPLLYRAIRSDHPGCEMRRQRALRPRQLRRRGPRPSLVLIGTSGAGVSTERQVIWLSWGSDVPVVGFELRSTQARVWCHPEVAQLIDIGPGFLDRFLATTVPGTATPVPLSIARERRWDDAAPLDPRSRT